MLAERVRDFFYAHGSKIKTTLKIGMSLLAIYVVLGAYLGWFSSDNKEVSEKTVDKKLDSSYTVLSKFEVGLPGKSATQFKVLVKDPFITSEEFDALMAHIVEKEKKLKESKDKDLYAAEIFVYTRKYQFDNNIDAPFKSVYQNEDGWGATFDSRLMWYRNHVYKNTFVPLEIPIDSEVKYLTTKEYKLFIRLLEWSAMSSDDTESGIYNYLKFDRGMTEEDPKFYKLVEKYNAMIDRAVYYGEPSMMFEGKGDYLIEYYSENDKRFKKYAEQNL